MLLANELISITLPDGTTVTIQVLGPANHDAFSIFESLCLLGNGEHPQFLQLQYLHKTFSLKLIESELTNYHQPTFPKRVSLTFTYPIPVYQRLPSNRHVHSIARTSYCNTTTSSSSLKHAPSAPLTRLHSETPMLSFSCSSNYSPSSRRRPSPSPQHSPNSLMTK
jgi:Guanine nucleotide exchange factor in Golgi transport N-terminal